jgi:hypothetical protein
MPVTSTICRRDPGGRPGRVEPPDNDADALSAIGRIWHWQPEAPSRRGRLGLTGSQSRAESWLVLVLRDRNSTVAQW